MKPVQDQSGLVITGWSGPVNQQNPRGAAGTGSQIKYSSWQLVSSSGLIHSAPINQPEIDGQTYIPTDRLTLRGQQGAAESRCGSGPELPAWNETWCQTFMESPVSLCVVKTVIILVLVSFWHISYQATVKLMVTENSQCVKRFSSLTADDSGSS